MKYIRTKDEIYDGSLLLREYTGWFFYESTKHYAFNESEIINQADTIEELCDEFVVIYDDGTIMIEPILSTKQGKYIKYGAIWTDKGLIYVAKMNEKGELELL